MGFVFLWFYYFKFTSVMCLSTVKSYYIPKAPAPIHLIEEFEYTLLVKIDKN